MPLEAQNLKGKRRIFCVITQGEEGGAQRFVTQIAHNLDSEHFLLHVVWGASSGNALARELPSTVSRGTAHYLQRSISLWRDTNAVYELRQQMREFRPDIVFCISSKAGFVGSLAAHGLRTEFPDLCVIYRIGGWTFNDPWPAWKKKLFLFLEKISARWKDYIVLNNQHDYDQAETLSIQPRKELLRIYNGLDAYLPFLEHNTARSFLDARVPESYRSQPYQWLIGTVANLYETKGIDTLIHAASQTEPSTRFIVIGDGPQRRTLERLIIRQKLENRFFLLGRLEDAWKYLTGLDVFILPSLKEGFPWALLEAMAAKVPVVATRVGAVPEMIADGVSGLICEPGNSERLVQAITKLLANSDLRQSVTIDAHQQVLNKFTLREMISQYEKLLG